MLHCCNVASNITFVNFCMFHLAAIGELILQSCYVASLHVLVHLLANCFS